MVDASPVGAGKRMRHGACTTQVVGKGICPCFPYAKRQGNRQQRFKMGNHLLRRIDNLITMLFGGAQIAHQSFRDSQFIKPALRIARRFPGNENAQHQRGNKRANVS